MSSSSFDTEILLETADVLISKMRKELLAKNALILQLFNRITHLETALTAQSHIHLNVDSSPMSGTHRSLPDFSHLQRTAMRSYLYDFENMYPRPILSGRFESSDSLESVDQSFQSQLHSLSKYEECQNMLLLSIEQNEALESRLRDAEDLIECFFPDFDVACESDHSAATAVRDNINDSATQELRLRAEESEEIIRLIKHMFQTRATAEAKAAAEAKAFAEAKVSAAAKAEADARATAEGKLMCATRADASARSAYEVTVVESVVHVPFGADAQVNHSHTLASTHSTSRAEHGHISVKRESSANAYTVPHSPPAIPSTKLSLKDRLAAAKRSVISVPASGVDFATLSSN